MQVVLFCFVFFTVNMGALYILVFCLPAVRSPVRLRFDCIVFYYMAELVHGEKEHSDWFPKQSEFYFTDR